MPPKKECNISTFREIKLEMLDVLRNKNEICYKRLYHYVHENQRVIAVKECLQMGAANELGNILIQSHASLRDMYEVSCEEIDYIIKLSDNFDGWYGGRIIGGGFGGCSIHLLTNHKMEYYYDYITANYTKRYNIIPDILKVTFPGGLQNL